MYSRYSDPKNLFSKAHTIVLCSLPHPLEELIPFPYSLIDFARKMGVVMLSSGYLLTDGEESIEGKKIQKGRKFRERKKSKKKTK